MYGWMSPFVEPIPMQDDGWCGQLTLPREIMLVAELRLADRHLADAASSQVNRPGLTEANPLTQSGRHAARRYQAFTNRVSEIAFQLLGFPVQG